MAVDFVINEEDLPDKNELTPNIRITDEDLAVQTLPIVTVTIEDLLKIDQQVIRIIDNDLPAIVRIDDKDLPEILKIKIGDLPPDLTNVVTDCFHGTSWEAAEKIRKEGFRVGRGAAYGSGIYFSVGGMTIANSYIKSSKPCIVQARVDWGRVIYLDDPKTPAKFKGSGERPSKAALKEGYHSFLSKSKYSRSSPTMGIVLGEFSKYVKPPRIEVVDLINPTKKK